MTKVISDSNTVLLQLLIKIYTKDFHSAYFGDVLKYDNILFIVKSTTKPEVRFVL